MLTICLHLTYMYYKSFFLVWVPPYKYMYVCIFINHCLQWEVIVQCLQEVGNKEVLVVHVCVVCFMHLAMDTCIMLVSYCITVQTEHHRLWLWKKMTTSQTHSVSLASVSIVALLLSSNCNVFSRVTCIYNIHVPRYYIFTDL